MNATVIDAIFKTAIGFWGIAALATAAVGGFAIGKATHAPATTPKAALHPKAQASEAEKRQALIRAGAVGEIIELYCGDAGTDYEADVCERAGYEFQDENERAGAVPQVRKLSI